MWPNPHETADLVTFTEEIFNGKRHFCVVLYAKKDILPSKQHGDKPKMGGNLVDSVPYFGPKCSEL